jgi:thiosulfate/3-mercaptopyruvate sulfurtransferase
MTVVPVSQRGYARPEFLAETEWLAQHLNNPKVRIVDARPPGQYSAGHIPGAVNLTGFTAIPRAANQDMAPPEEFNRVAGNLGISNDMTVAVYDTPTQLMGMIAWGFLYYGHQDVCMLDGGFNKWSGEGRPISSDSVSYPPAAYKAKPMEDIYCSLAQAKASHGQPDTIFWDTRSRAEYEGSAASAGGEPPPRLGRIPGAVHLEWSELLEPDTKTFKTAADLRALLESKRITPEKKINTY